MRTQPYSRNLQGKGVRTHVRNPHIYVHLLTLRRLVLRLSMDAKTRLLKFLSIGGDRSDEQCPPRSSRVIESNIFDVSHYRRSKLEVCYREHVGTFCISWRSIYMYTRASIWMENLLYLSALPCPVPGIVTQLKNAINLVPLLWLRIYTLKLRFHRSDGNPRKSIYPILDRSIQLWTNRSQIYLTNIADLVAFHERAHEFMFSSIQILSIEFWFKS